MNLVIHQGALGDWVVTFPLLEALGPTPTVAVAANSKAKLAARLLSHVTPMSIEVADWSSLHALDAAPSARQRDVLAAASSVFSFVSTGDDAFAANLRRLCPPTTRHFFIQPRPPASWRAHVADWHLAQLHQQGFALPLAGGQRPADAIQRPNAAGRCPPAKNSSLILLHPGSGGRDKCWPLDRFEALMTRLRQTGRSVTPILGEVELDRWPRAIIERWQSEHGATVIDSLNALCDALLSAGAFIGNDSGPTHLAAWLGISTLALFGPSSATHWAPRGPSVTVLVSESGTMEGLSVEDVLANALCHGLPQ